MKMAADRSGDSTTLAGLGIAGTGREADRRHGRELGSSGSAAVIGGPAPCAESPARGPQQQDSPWQAVPQPQTFA